MKQIIKPLFAVFAVLFLLISCTGSNSDANNSNETNDVELEVSPKSISITGGLGDYLEIVQNKYKLKIGKLNQQLTIQFKRKDKLFDFDAPYLAELGYFKITATCLDGQEVPVNGYGEGGTGDSEKKLVGLKPGEFAWVTFTFWAGDNAEFNSIKKFEINSESKVSIDEMKNVQGASLGAETPNNEDVGVAQNLEGIQNFDCDQFYKQYEAFVDSYSKLLKKYKANPSDLSIIEEYNEAVEKANELQSTANNCDDPKYANKLLELTKKMANALK
jgi:hypothetical protein